MIDTCLFDLDGTLINTNDLIIASFLHTLNHYYPGRYTKKDVIAFIGEPLEVSFQRVDPDRVKELCEHYRRYNLEKHDELVKEFPNVNDTLKTLKEKGYKLGIVTTKRRETVNLGIRLTKIEPFFDVIVTIDDVKRPKPAPDPVRLALEKLGSKPEQAVMIGDSPFDIEAGRSAGTKTVGVSWTIKGVAALREVHPDYLIDDMKELLAIVDA